MTLDLEQAILEAVRALPQDKEKEVLDHAKHGRGQEAHSREPREPGRGLWPDLEVDLSVEEIDEARHELWKEFSVVPRRRRNGYRLNLFAYGSVSFRLRSVGLKELIDLFEAERVETIVFAEGAR
jgi:hypothetical protein